MWLLDWRRLRRHGTRLTRPRRAPSGATGVAVVALFVVGAGAQPLTPALTQLQGRWVVTGGEHNGKPMDSIKGGVMTIAGDSFEVRTASGTLLKGTLRLDASKRPSQMDMLHADGERWEAIYAVDGEAFRLNYVPAGGKDVRPQTFRTSAKTEASIVTLRRENR